MSTTYSIKSGQKLRFAVPCRPEKGWGEFPTQSEDAIRGWTVDDSSAGTLALDTSDTEKGCTIVYTHSSSIKGNVLTFTTADGRQEHVILVLPSTGIIHNHASLDQGGPAYGTYASLLDEELPGQ